MTQPLPPRLPPAALEACVHWAHVNLLACRDAREFWHICGALEAGLTRHEPEVLAHLLAARDLVATRIWTQLRAHDERRAMDERSP